MSHSLESLPGLEFSQTMSLAIGGLQPKVWAAAGLARKPQAAKSALPTKSLTDALARKAAPADRRRLEKAVTEPTWEAEVVQGVAGCAIFIQSSPSPAFLAPVENAQRVRPDSQIEPIRELLPGGDALGPLKSQGRSARFPPSRCGAVSCKYLIYITLQAL